MKHDPKPETAENLDTLMGIDVNKKDKHKHKEKKDVKPGTADGISNLLGFNVRPTSHENQLKGNKATACDHEGREKHDKAKSVLGMRDDSDHDGNGKALLSYHESADAICRIS